MIYGTILVCAMEIASCNPDNAYKAVQLPMPMPSVPSCMVALTEFAATSVVPLGSLTLVCGRGYIKLNSVPV